MIRFIVPLVAFSVLVSVFYTGLDPERDVNELPSPFLGKQAPQLTCQESGIRKNASKVSIMPAKLHW